MTKRMKIEAAVRESDEMRKPIMRKEYRCPLTSYRGKNRIVEAAVRDLDDMR